MYEKASKADVTITLGLFILIMGMVLWFMHSFDPDIESFIFMAVGVVVLGLGFALDKLEIRKKKQLNLEKLRPQLRRYLDEASGLMAKGKKAGETEKYRKSLDLFLAANRRLEIAEKVSKEFDDEPHQEEILKALTTARDGVATSRYGIAFKTSKNAMKLYDSGKYKKAKDGYEKALEYLIEASKTQDREAEVQNVRNSLLLCQKRLAEKELDATLKEVEAREELFQNYLAREFLFEAREMLNEMEVAIQKGTELAESYDFTTAMEELNQALERIRIGKGRVEDAILQKLKIRTGDKEAITPLMDKIDPTLRKVAVDVAEDIEVYSGYDFRGGAIRVQYTIQNSRKTAVSELQLRILRDERILSLIEVNPDYTMKFNEVILGTLGPDEKRMVNLYFDPHTCGELVVDTSLTYIDSSGAYHSLVPERKVIDIPKPEIGKGEMINSSYLNSLMEKAQSKGQRTFLIPAGLERRRAFTLVLETLETSGIRQVWKRKDDSAGYYVRCDGDECALIISSTKEAVELQAISQGESGVTNLLTMVSGAIRQRLDKEGHKNVSISLNIQDSVLNRTNISLGDLQISPQTVTPDEGKQLDE